MIEITAIRLAGGNGHEHITDVLWRSAATFIGLSPVEAIVDWLSGGGESQAIVVDGTRLVEVAVVRSTTKTPYLRAQVDGVWTNDLLSLPVF